ncbi:MAG: prephenate dehydratase [Phycisphaerales bacterium]
MPRRPAKSRAASPRRAQRAAMPAFDLDALRVGIDRLDRRIIKLLNDRSKLVVQVGKYKQARGIPIYAPHREAEVLAKVLQLNQGPLPARAIEGIYRELMSGSFALEQPLKIGYLGPPGSFSHVAATRHFGSSVSFEDLHEIAGVFTEVQRGHVDYGLVPIENSIHGGVTETLDALIASAEKVHVYAEVQLEVHHALMANCSPKSIERICSKPEVFSQCRTWLATQYPRAELVPVASSSRAVQMVAEESLKVRGSSKEGPPIAAIGNALAGELYDVNILFPKIEDNPHNITRFFVISRQQAQRSGQDKTSIMFATLNKPGALVSVLNVFHRAGVNLTHIDKRPSGRTNWSYSFFIDAEGHESDPALAGAIARARKHCRELHVLGSYPRSRRIL